MPKLMPVLAAVTAISGIVSAHLWQQLRSEREQTVLLHARVTQLELAQTRTSLNSATAGLAPGQAAKPAPTGTPTEPTPGSETAATAQETPAARNNNPAATINARELLKDPDFRAGMAASMRNAQARLYADLAKELGISQEQADKLLDLLAKQQIGLVSEGLPNGSEAQGALLERVRKQDAEVSALLGDTKYQQWKEYQETVPARQTVNALRSALASSEQPLNPQLERQLITALTADQKRQTTESRQSTLPVASADPSNQTAMMADVLRRKEASNSRSLEVAGAYLNPRQLEAMRKQQDQDLGILRALARAGGTANATGQSAGVTVWTTAQ